MSTANSFARRRAWVRSAERVGDRWRSYIVLLAGAAALIAAFALIPGLPVRLLYCGITAGAVLMLLTISVSGFDDPVMLGSVAEEWTVEAFDKQKWPVVNNLAFTDGDLDHLVVAPCGVLAVETKFRFRQSDKARRARQRRADLAAAHRAGRKAALLLRSRTIDVQANVTPVLVIWGAGQPELPDGYRIVEGVYILDGAHPQLWAHLFAAPLLTAAHREELTSALSRYRAKQRQHTTTEQNPLHQECWVRFRAGVIDSERLRHAKRQQAAALRRRHTAVDPRRVAG